MSKLQHKVALVTGASKGIGAGIAKALAAEGAAVIVNYASSQADADQVVADIKAAGGRAVAVGGDVTQAGEAKAIVQAAIEAYGRLDILVNNAGVYAFQTLEEITADQFHHQFNINVLGLLLVTQAAAPHLPAGGSVINIGSLITRLRPAGSAIYAGTKAAVEAVTGVLAAELGPRQIRVNALNPGLVQTEGTQAAGIIGGDFESQAAAASPLGRIGQPQDIAKIAVFLASDEAGWLTGESLFASGGVH